MTADTNLKYIKEQIGSVKDKKSSEDDLDFSLTPEKLKADRYKRDTYHRSHLAWTVMATIMLWLLFVMVIVVLCLFRQGLSDAVLIALLGTTTANIIGLAMIVLKGFFQYMDQTVSFKE